MSRAAGGGVSTHSDQQPHISFDFTVPSQGDDFLHTPHTHPMSSSDSHGHGGHGHHEYMSQHTANLRRKRSSSREEDDEEEEGGDEDEDDEYLPQARQGDGVTGRYYPSGNGHSGTSSYRRGSTSAGPSGSGTFDLSMLPGAGDMGMRLGVGGQASTSSSPFHPPGGAQRKGTQQVRPDGQPPPKKKRRRQALSCTECKRRKIRCDRAQPCAPCMRRGEGDKCKWNILEPVEKFVTRKEYDEIKDSLSRLENILTTATPNGQVVSGSANEEVAAAVNIVKSKAGILGRVISDAQHHQQQPAASSASGQPPLQSLRGRGQSNSYADIGSIPAVPSSSPHPSHQHNQHYSSGGGAPFAYQPLALNVPSQSTGHSDAGDEDHYGSAGGTRNIMSSHSHSASTDFSRPSSSAYPSASHVQSISGHFQSGDPFTGQSSYPNQHQRIPEINLGSFVVEDQSQSSLRENNGDLFKNASADQAASLSTLANLANASSMTSSSRFHLQPMHQQQQSRHESPATNPSRSLTLAPIGQGMSLAGRSPTLSISPALANANAGGMGMLPPPSLTPTRLPMEGGPSRETQLRRVLQTCLPRREICDRLVEYYFEKVEWSLILLHRTSFMRACETFWFLSEDERVKIVSPTTPTSATSWGGGFRASFLPPASDYSMGYAKLPAKAPSSSKKGQRLRSDDQGVNPSWISLFLAVLCVALERLGYWDAKSIGIIGSVEDYKLQCRNLYDGSQTAMTLGDFLKSRALESVQAMVLHMHCQQTFTTTEWEAQISVTLSVAARLGMMMGLNKLTPEKVGSSQRPGLLKRELGRRAWWNLIERDWTLSPRVGHTYAINPAHNFCDLPANVEWEDLVFNRSTFKQQKREVWTGASSFLARIDIARTSRELTDQYNTFDGVPYNLLLKHESILEETISRAPPQLLRPDGEFELSTPQGQWDRFHFTFHAHYRIITLHRPYLVASLLEVKAQETRNSATPDTVSTHSYDRYDISYRKSLDTCIRSAETILDTMEEAISSQYPGIQWWQSIIHCYTAAVVLLIERWYKSEAKPGSLESEDADERRRKIQAASALLREQYDAIDLFAQAANALDSLLDATTSARRKARRSGRRGMDIHDVVNPVNVSSRASVASGNTPPFVRDWIDRPNTPMPNAEAPPHQSQAPSLSAMALLPGMPLVADTSYDSQFWARIFDLEFVAPVDVTEMFFPSEELEMEGMEGGQHSATEDVAVLNSSNGGGGGTVFSGMDTTSAWRSAAASGNTSSGPASRGAEGGNDATSGTLGGSAIWSAVTGPIGSSGANEGWPRVSPYGSGNGRV